MFPPAPYDLEAIKQGCIQQFGVIPRVDWMVTWFGGLNMSASNILFSNGNLDPWSGGGVTESLSDTLIAINIEDSAHHLDLRFPNPADPPAVVAARKQEAEILQKWLGQYYSRTGINNPMPE
jgi:lysosomal Pro-X carboxypeptidase